MKTICYASPYKVRDVVIAMMLMSGSAYAASGTWTGTTDNTWQTSSNWSASPFPGATSGFASADIATFAAAGSGTIDLGGTLNVKSILIGTNGGNAGALTIGDAGDTLNLTSGGNITVGAGVTANETIGTAGGGSVNLSTTNNSTYSFQNFGSGSLNIVGAVTANQATGSSVLTLGGSGNGTISGVLGNAGAAGASGLALTKAGSGSWTLSGTNTYTGATTVNAGQLILDYSGITTPANTGTKLVVSGGNLVIKGNASGTTMTVSSLALTGSFGVNTLTLDANGGSGVALTIGTFSGASRSNLIDVSSSAGNSITVNALSGQSVANGVLMAGSTGSYRATNIVKDTGGYGFATLTGGPGSTIGRLTSGSSSSTGLTAAASNATHNYWLTTAGTVTRTAGLDFNTITIETTTNGGITLDMNSNTFGTSTAGGRTVLITGNGDAAINNGSVGTIASVYFQNYGTGTFSTNLTTGSFSTTFGGPGFTNFSGIVTNTTSQAQSGIYLNGGITRFSLAQNLVSTTPINVTGAVFEIGADLNGATAGDFTIAINNSNAAGIKFYTDAGLSAAGADRVVNFGGVGAALNWGSMGFLTNVDGTTDGGYTLKLSSARSDKKLTIQNGIGLGTNTHRVIDVANGSADTDAALSGVLSGSGATLVKKGAGTLSLDGVNTYSGATLISEGKLALGSTGSLASTTYSIGNGAIFDVSAQSSYSLAAVGVTIDVGSTSAGFFKGPSGALTLGNALTLNFTTSMLTDGQTYNLFDFGSQTGDFSSVALSGSIAGSLLLTGADTWTGSFGGYDFTFSESSGTLALSLATIPEPSTYALLFGGASLFLAVCRQRHGRSRSLVK